MTRPKAKKKKFLSNKNTKNVNMNVQWKEFPNF